MLHTAFSLQSTWNQASHLVVQMRNTCWKRLLEPYLMPVTPRLYADINWEQEAATFNPSIEYPDYYCVPHHGIAEGYLSPCQTLVWEGVESLFRLARVRPALLQQACIFHPRVIVDMGCGTATTSLALLRLLPQASLWLVDLSPYALVAARRQAQYAGLAQRTHYLHSAAEQTRLADEVCDLALACLLFHELPQTASHQVLREAQRILKPRGHLLLLDPVQRLLPWPRLEHAINTGLASCMREVYWMEYMQQPLWEVCQEAGFSSVRRELLVAFPWVYQLVIATK